MKRSKKGSLSLSINAIVVLILAITMLGLGLGFVRNMFSQGEKSLTTIFDTTKLKNPATAGDPIKVPTSVKGRAGEKIDVEFSIYNTASISWNEVKPKLGKCYDSDGAELVAAQGTMTLPSLAATSTDISPSNAVGWNTIFTLPSGTDVEVNNVYLCSINFQDSETTPNIRATAQFTVQIVS